MQIELYIRNMPALYRRITNQLYGVVNKLKLKLLSVQYGRHCIIHGPLSIQMDPLSELVIGDHFCFLSGRSLNPLSKNIRGCIRVNKGAKVIIGDNVNISSATIWAHNEIKIGNRIDIGANVILLDSDAHSMNFLDRRIPAADMANKIDSPIEIKDDVLIGVNSIILKGVTIGARCVIGAGSVVTKSIPNDCVAAGNPCKVIKRMDSNSTKD